MSNIHFPAWWLVPIIMLGICIILSVASYACMRRDGEDQSESKTTVWQFFSFTFCILVLPPVLTGWLADPTSFANSIYRWVQTQVGG